MTDQCVVTSDEIEPGMWRLACCCGWSSLVPDVERVGATLAHLAAVDVDESRITPRAPTAPARPLPRRPLLGRPLLVLLVALGLALALWWAF